MKRILFVLACIVALSSCAKKEMTADYDISYSLSFDMPNKYIDVAMTYIPEVGASQSDVTFKMPVWAPGYYLILDYPTNVSDFKAIGCGNKTLDWEKVGKTGWKVETSDTVRVSYRVFADFHSVAECRVEEDAAFVPGNGVFMYVADDTAHPVTVSFDLPDNWSKISTSLEKKNGVYYAPDFDVLYDSPFLLGNHYSETINHDGIDYEFAVETPQGFSESPIKNDFLAAVDQAIAIFGEAPYKSYHLLLLGAGGGGLEHQSSQADYTAGRWDFKTRKEYLNILMFLTHEYFHNYNVKAIRPIELGPFDYDAENYTTGLWFSEGITCYYESLLLERAGIISNEERLKYLSEFIRDTENTEGRKHMDMRTSSYDIWLNFFNRNANAHDTTISYYIKGPVIGLLMDCQIQTVSGGKKSLDDFMKTLYEKYYKAGRGFTEEEFWADAEQVAGGSLEIIRRYVDTTDEIDYEQILSPVGISIDRSTWTLSCH